MTLLIDRSRTILEGQNIRPPLGTFFNGQSYWMKVHPELGRANRSVLVVKMILQFQFANGSGGSWTQAEKNTFAHGFVDSITAVWSEKFRITTTSNIPLENLRDVGVVFDFPYYIDGWHVDDDFELTVTKIPSGGFERSCVTYNFGNSALDSEDLTPVQKSGTMLQRGAVHEFGHMLGLDDEYPEANSNKSHTGDVNSVMHGGEIVQERHYAPFAAWLKEKFAVAAHLSRSDIDYKVNGRTNMANAGL
jgi:hypothetical protein